jgi:general secretion pathway protein G
MKHFQIRRHEGFTLLELIVVITIIGLLGTLVVVNTSGVTQKARTTKIKSDLTTIVSAAEMMYTDSGSYPESIEEMINPKDEDGNARVGGLKEFPKDPWGNEYFFEIIDGSPRATCLGKDQVEGGDGDNKDYTEPETDESGF